MQMLGAFSCIHTFAIAYFHQTKLIVETNGRDISYEIKLDNERKKHTCNVQFVDDKMMEEDKRFHLEIKIKRT